VSEAGRRLVLVGRERVEIETFDVPEPGPGQVLVRVHRSQVSAGSEKNAFLGASNPEARRTTGYTTVGRVLAVGPGVEEYREGERVLAFGNHGSHWLTGQAGRSELGASIQRIEHEITDEQAAFAVLADVALHGVRRAQLQIDEPVAIFGQGVVGQLVTAFCRLSGAYPVIAVEPEAERLDLSMRSGATHGVGAAGEDAVTAVRDLTGGGAQCVFHATRDPRALIDCMQAAGDRAKVILVGSPPGTVEIGLQVELLRRELDIRGSYERGLENNPHPYWPWTRQRNRKAIMRMIAAGDLHVDHLISHVAAPEEANTLFQKIVAGPRGWMSVFFDWT
jgi:2-desacetyl-2-hydroxyethyl bacteriochlorophyllide A dehydrogenase